MLPALSDEPEVALRRGADDRLGDGFRTSYEREAIADVLRDYKRLSTMTNQIED